ncbi:hypothetical protein [Thermomonospora cellulosilytica]|uniref:Tetratricopeptide (TPR) repeat protein n=1 Tax=Thermomonospora cellulosilytica TaxID=1411118 RepID=A0A7W3N3G1_9ACTN|nr:hypothetical protein [Thermomonospora cellulosilytica]MBA9006820.1 tetratricopeptide (TPR) repeat protein [Thermomonospora cellulosilytica]
MSSKRNEELATLTREAGYSEAGLAHRVNALGAARGHSLGYDYSAVYRWVTLGQKPRPPVPSLIAEALSERLGRRVAPADFGMTDEGTLVDRTLLYASDASHTVVKVLELGKADMKRRSMIIKAPFVLSALAAPSRDWLVASLGELTDGHGPRRVGMKQVEGIREMFRLFQQMDVMHGGGHARMALLSYMNDYVLPLLRERHPETIMRALYEAASEQCYLVGWMAYDDGQHGLAQRYLIQSLSLAQASGNAALGAHVLAGMSDQANLLGHPREALQLARTGQRGIKPEMSAACMADLYVLEGRALAALGMKREAARAVANAERIFQRVNRDEEPEWARFIDVAYLFGEAAMCFRDAKAANDALRFADESIADAGRQGRARRGALSYATRAISHLHRADADPAKAAADAAVVLDLAGQVASTRIRATVTDLVHRLQPYSKVKEVEEFLDRARVLKAA